MKLTGHKIDRVFRRYDIVSDSDLDEAADRMGECKAVQGILKASAI